MDKCYRISIITKEQLEVLGGERMGRECLVLSNRKIRGSCWLFKDLTDKWQKNGVKMKCSMITITRKIKQKFTDNLHGKHSTKIRST